VKSTNTTPAQNIDAGKLLTASEIQDVLGEPLKQPIASTRNEAGFVISQSYFLLATPAKSAVLTVTSRAGTGRSPRGFWMEKFHDHGAEEKDREAEPERPKQQPEKIDGLGDEAYWVASGSTGALYVLQGDAFIRVAIGGEDEKSARVEKAKRLARYALKRLPAH
jgi:hypothetical protein